MVTTTTPRATSWAGSNRLPSPLTRAPPARALNTPAGAPATSSAAASASTSRLPPIIASSSAAAAHSQPPPNRSVLRHVHVVIEQVARDVLVVHRRDLQALDPRLDQV